MQNLILLSIGLAIVIDFVLLAVLFRERADALVKVFRHLILGALFWNTCTLLFILTESPLLPPFAYISALYFFVARHLFIVKYTHNETPRELRILIGSALILAILAFVPHALFVNPHVSPEGYINVQNGWFTIHFAIYLIYMTFRPLQLLFHYRRNTHHSHELNILTFGMSLYALITISTNFILPVFFDIAFLNTIGPAFSSVFSLIIFYAMGRYQFLHVKLIIQRGIIFSVLFGCVVALYSAITAIFVFLTRNAVHANDFTIALTILIAALLVPPLEQKLRHLTDRVLLQQTYRYGDVTRALAHLFAQHFTTRAILRHTLAYMKATLRLRHIRYHKGMEIPEALRMHNSAWAVSTGAGCIGYVLVGQKRSHDPLTNTDQDILEFYTTILGVALEKARLFEHLEDEVAARTKEIEQIHTEEHSRLAILAHDLKTPLTVLLGTHELVSKAPEITREQFEKLGMPLQAMKRTINEIVRFEHHTEAEYVMVPFSHLLHDIAEQMGVLCDMEKIHFTHAITPNIFLTGDSRSLELMINNILSNAIRYRTKHAPTLSLSLTQEKNTIEVTVSDNGIGIPAVELPRIFMCGYRTENARRLDGTGTGLTMVKKIAEAHGATVHVESTEHIGTTVSIKFQTPAVHSA
ncbi:hypothetical protein A3C87_03780 [Candidatus Kaiserbacteria bacterium RIFCSPHIGHO2_02_FULL_49_34]|uniref:histidine kinase n=1 Tax=Candidatus Kaiserbacteria bacterium RIFCSPHIGHO2_02_FULL_49_34 TaxID=1798491 RepID=A0A1F6DIY9_9BACT|nr:MAG: hypothetical protein A3C87_03780 [Candidatus Kaiserbacteria bacterium RIFCSPHIGHO2_02_FULL_49_34]